MSEGGQGCGDAVDAGIVTSSGQRSVSSVPESYKYKTDYPCMGHCLIINNENFLFSKDRTGTNEDAAALRKTFASLGYKVEVKKNLRAAEMRTALLEASEKDHRDNASFVCVLLSHGNEDGILGIDGKLVDMETLTGNFKRGSNGLLGKPKLFFIQACRGKKTDEGRDFTDSDGFTRSRKLPLEADFLYAYATPPGYYAWRRVTCGSWFIQSLCGMIEKHRDLELMHILIRVNNSVAQFESNTDEKETHQKKEIPCFVSMLTKEFYFSTK